MGSASGEKPYTIMSLGPNSAAAFLSPTTAATFANSKFTKGGAVPSPHVPNPRRLNAFIFAKRAGVAMVHIECQLVCNYS